MRTVEEVKGEESALFVCRIPDGRPGGGCILLELDHAGIRRDVEVVAGMAAYAASFRCFARGESTSTKPGPEILSNSLFIKREIQS